jgi:flagellin
MLSAMNQLDAERSITMARLATGKRINRASDDPAGLIALNTLNAELASVGAAIDSNRRSESMLNVADSTLTEVGKLVSDIEGLVLKASGSTVTASEKAAYQAQIDQSLDSIDRLVNQAEFNGKKLFDGENRINAYASDATAIKDVRVYSRNPNISGNLALTVAVNAAATRGSAATTLGAAVGDTLSAATVVQVTGKLGTATLTLGSGATGTDVLAAITAHKEITGVSAISQGGSLHLMSTTTGSDAFVAVSALSGDADYMSGLQISKTAGADAQVTVNGAKASAQGTEVFYNGAGVSLSFNLASNTVANYTLTVADGGAEFQLGTDSNTRTGLGLGGVNSFELGRSDLGYLSQLRSGGVNSLNASDSKALAVARQASNQVATAAARVGSFNKYAVGSSIRSLEAAQEGMSAAASQIGDTDYSVESANLERQTILMNAAISMLSVANSQQANALALLQ